MSSRKKFYFLVNSLEGGGAERVITNLSHELAREHDISIITLKDANFYDLAPGVRHIALSHVRNNILMFVLIPWYVLRLRRLLVREGFDNGVSFLEISNFVHILAKRGAIISSRIHLDFFVGISGHIYRILIRWLYPRSGHIIVNSAENGLDISRRLAIDPGRITTIYNPIDLERVIQLSTETSLFDLRALARGRKAYVTVGRLVWQKHHAKILHVFSRLRVSGVDDFVYYIVGDGPERARLEWLVQSLGLSDRVFFFGEQRNIFPFLSSSDCFVYASQVEWFPNVLIEAMACGLPIITSDFVSGAKECILGEYPKNSWKSLKYPYFGPNGVLLDLEHFEDQFAQVYPRLAEIGRSWIGLDRFDIRRSAQNLIHLLCDHDS